MGLLFGIIWVEFQLRLVSLKRWTCAGLIILFCDKNGCGIQKVASTHPPTHPPTYPPIHPPTHTPFITSYENSMASLPALWAPTCPNPMASSPAHGSEPHDSPALSAPTNYVSKPCSEFATFLCSSRPDLFGEFALCAPLRAEPNAK